MMQIDSYFLTWNYQIANFRRCILLKGTRKEPSWKSKKIHPSNSTLPRTALLLTFGLLFVFFEMYKPETSALAQFSTHSGKVNNYLDPIYIRFQLEGVTILIVKMAYESPIHGTTYNLLIHKGYNPISQSQQDIPHVYSGCGLLPGCNRGNGEKVRNLGHVIQVFPATVSFFLGA